MIELIFDLLAEVCEDDKDFVFVDVNVVRGGLVVVVYGSGTGHISGISSGK